MTDAAHNHFTTDALQPLTMRNYNRAIDRWLACWKTPPTLAWLVAHPEEAVRVLRSSPDIKNTPSNHHTFLNAVASYVKHETKDAESQKVWRDIQYRNSEPLREHRLDEAPSNLQAGKDLDWEDILRVRDALPLSSTKLLLAFYTYINPMRADYFATELVYGSREPEGNYILCMPRNRYVLVVQDYKTKKAHGDIETLLPEPLAKLLTEYINAGMTGSFLFQNEKDEPFERATFSNWANARLSKAMGKRTTLTALRHAFASQLDFNRPLRELRDVAHSMGHSVGTQRTYKWT